MNKLWRAGLVCGILLPLAAGCKPRNYLLEYAGAINSYYASRPDCLWAEPHRFPVQVDRSDKQQVQVLDALVDRGLLLRTERAGSAATTLYDLNGRGQWREDAQQPGLGNFCYGHRNVKTIDEVRPGSGSMADRTTVRYHYSLLSVPTWAIASDMQKAFPAIRAAINGDARGSAVLTHTTGADRNEVWTMLEPGKPAE